MRLTKRDYEVLSLLNRCRYATTKQLVELYFRENKPKTATRRANLLTKNYPTLGLSIILNAESVACELGAVRMFGTSPTKGLRHFEKLSRTSSSS